MVLELKSTLTHFAIHTKTYNIYTVPKKKIANFPTTGNSHTTNTAATQDTSKRLSITVPVNYQLYTFIKLWPTSSSSENSRKKISDILSRFALKPQMFDLELTLAYFCFIYFTLSDCVSSLYSFICVVFELFFLINVLFRSKLLVEQLLKVNQNRLDINRWTCWQLN